MTDVEMKIEVEVEDFAEALSDQALDREEAGARWCAGTI